MFPLPTPLSASVLLALLSASAIAAPYPLCSTAYPGYVDIRSIQPDLAVPNIWPNITFEAPRPGTRVYSRLPGWLPSSSAAGRQSSTSAAPGIPASPSANDYFMLYLPTDYSSTSPALPVVIELPGNGPYTSPWGDVSNGRPDDTFLGYGITEGRGAIWAAVPFLTAEGHFDQTLWWGCPENGALWCQPAPANNSQGCVSTQPPPCFAPPAAGCPNATNTDLSKAYLQQVVAHILSAYNGDPRRVVLAGFSRGAIGVNYLGLADDATAELWAGSVAYAHYFGQPEDLSWPFPDNTAEAGYARLRRLGSRPQFICSELDSTLNQTKPYIEAAGFPVNATYAPTGFCNHNSEWVLRPSQARDQLRRWWASTTAQP